jgi:hypothetical protein
MVRAQMSLAAGMVAVCLLLAGEPNGAQAADSQRLVQRTYEVADLIVPHDPHIGAPGQSVEKKSAPISPEEMLIKMIVNTIEPRSWSDMDGPGTVDYFPLGRALVINQTPDIQEQVAELLASLRRQAAAEITLETRIIDVSAKQVRVLKRQLGIQELNEEAPALLDAAQAGHLLALVQAERSTRVLQAPRLRLVNGQAGNCTITETADTGLSLGLRGVVALDRQSIDVHVIAALTRHPADEDEAEIAYWEVDHKVSVPTGNTALFLAQRPEGSPSGRRVIVVVTPKLVLDEEEDIQTGVGVQ